MRGGLLQVQHVLMRKAGLRSDRPRPRGRRHNSEYQRQFEWKDRVANSTLLAADRVQEYTHTHSRTHARARARTHARTHTHTHTQDSNVHPSLSRSLKM